MKNNSSYFNGATLIVAHPDDECLFASSILKEVSTFAESSISRRKFLLNYFGDKYDPNIINDYDFSEDLTIHQQIFLV